MSSPTSPYLLFNNQYGYGREAFGPYALMPRFGCVGQGGEPSCPLPSPGAVAQQPVMSVSSPCCGAVGANGANVIGQDVLGIGANKGILEYQFGSALNAPRCGIPLPQAGCLMPGMQPSPDCAKCPCQTQSCSTVGRQGATETTQCDYGFARNPASAFGPQGGNRYGLIKWGG